jgi:hypothetical protein
MIYISKWLHRYTGRETSVLRTFQLFHFILGRTVKVSLSRRWLFGQSWTNCVTHLGVAYGIGEIGKSSALSVCC